MPLTGPLIEAEIAAGRIEITPFDPRLVGPDSVDLHLHPEILYYDTGGPLDMRKKNRMVSAIIGREGYLLNPGKIYLGRTVEVLWSDHHMAAVVGRSGIARFGLGVHKTAPFIHVGFRGTVTLEISVVEPLIVNVEEPICQVFFFRMEGEMRLYDGRYQGQESATPSRLRTLFEDPL